MRELIRKTRTLTSKPFGIGVILTFPHKENLKAILEEKVAVLQLYWGECSKELVLEAHKAGVKVVPQVSFKHKSFLTFNTLLLESQNLMNSLPLVALQNDRSFSLTG